jgi:NTE family protein
MTATHCPEPNRQHRSDAEARSRSPLAVNEGAGIALALGGGFARGFAHLGVLEVLEQEHIPISAIVGTSIGGLLGAAYADGISVPDLCELGRHVRVRDFIRFHRQGQDTQRNDRIGRFVREWFLAAQVEELSIPTAIVTTDLNTGAPYVFTRGPLEVAIRATCAFPGLFKPVEHEGCLLADGCIVSPVPTAVAARMNARCVLSVAVGSNLKCASPGRKVAHIFDHMKGSRRRSIEPSWARRADILLEPEVHQIDWNDFSRVDEARAAGVDAMRRALPYLRTLLDGQSQPRGVAGTPGRAESRVAL